MFQFINNKISFEFIFIMQCFLAIECSPQINPNMTIKDLLFNFHEMGIHNKDDLVNSSFIKYMSDFAFIEMKALNTKDFIYIQWVGVISYLLDEIVDSLPNLTVEVKIYLQNYLFTKIFKKPLPSDNPIWAKLRNVGASLCSKFFRGMLCSGAFHLKGGAFNNYQHVLWLGSTTS